MQTAVTWLLQELEKVNYHPTEAMIIYAKKLEKQQIIDAFYQCGRDNFEHIKVINRSATEYYNETYGSKGSDEIEKSEKPINLPSSQTEISDEEIEKFTNEFAEKYSKVGITENEVSAFFTGMKWYREQLKKKQ